MLYLTARVASLYAVFDDSDYSVEWCDEEKVKKCISLGIEIQGVSSGRVAPIKNIKIDFDKWLFGKSHNHILKDAKKVVRKGDIVTFVSEGAKYKFKILETIGDRNSIVFSNGINSEIKTSDLDDLLGK